MYMTCIKISTNYNLQFDTCTHYICVYGVIISLFCALLWIIFVMASHLVKKHGVVQLNADATYSKYNHTTTKNMMSFT